MAVIVELHIDEVRAVLEKHVSSLKTRLAKERNALIREIVSKDLASAQNAVNTIQEGKIK